MLPQKRPPLFIGLGRLSPGLYTFLFPHEKNLDLFLEVSRQSPVKPPTVQLFTDSVRDASECNAAHLFERNAGALLAQVRAGGARLERIQLPARFPITLRWSESGSPDFLERILKPDGSDGETFATAVASEVRDLLARRAIPLELNAEPFGKVRVDPISLSALSGKRASLPSALRRRLQWLTSAHTRSRGKPDGAPFCEASIVNLSRMNLEKCFPSDRLLVRRFLEVRTWPMFLLPNARAVGQELACWLRNRGGYAGQSCPGNPP
jgi:hypothetical protein